MQTQDARLITIEMALTNQQRMLDELNSVIIEQGKEIDKLKKQNRYLLNLAEESGIKPLSEETPPPHY